MSLVEVELVPLEEELVDDDAAATTTSFSHWLTAAAFVESPLYDAPK